MDMIQIINENIIFNPWAYDKVLYPASKIPMKTVYEL